MEGGGGREKGKPGTNIFAGGPYYKNPIFIHTRKTRGRKSVRKKAKASGEWGFFDLGSKHAPSLEGVRTGCVFFGQVSEKMDGGVRALWP